MSQVLRAEMLFGMRCFNAETETQRDLDVRYKPSAFFQSKSTFEIVGDSVSQSNPIASSPKSIAGATFTPLSQLFSSLYLLPKSTSSIGHSPLQIAPERITSTKSKQQHR
jgi:hypothetical protein